ncbi:MAG TPA: sigma-70 family RNA polymerase sigma factor [Propionibacteriaceae bacterium]|nr:sigma-70 family RNA polymerase sigma factor [Propionibacteriaceae bacterium]
MTTLLSHDDEVELARRIEAGLLAREALDHPTILTPDLVRDLRQLVASGDAAWERFHLANLGLVHQAVRQSADSIADPEELFQEGCLGLSEAIMRFDHTRGVRFSTHAYRWIRRRVVPAARRAGCATEEPTSRLHSIAVVIRTRRALEEGGLPSGPDAVARELGRPRRWVEAHWTRGLRTYADLASNPDRHLAVEPEPDEPPDWWLDQLPSNEREVLVRRHGLRGLPASDEAAVAAALGMSPGEVHRLDTLAREHVRQLVTEGQCASFALPRIA